jgi:hypothetical protein
LLAPALTVTEGKVRLRLEPLEVRCLVLEH